jgi:hypothetical protein
MAKRVGRTGMPGPPRLQYRRKCKEPMEEGCFHFLLFIDNLFANAAQYGYFK